MEDAGAQRLASLVDRAGHERPPARLDGVASWPGPIYTDRWYEQGQGPMFWFVYFDPQGVVRRSQPGIEPINAPADRRR